MDVRTVADELRKANNDWVDLFYLMLEDFDSLTPQRKADIRRQMDELRTRIAELQEVRDAGVE